MNIRELRDALDATLTAGVDPDTTVVFDEEGEWRVVGEAISPHEPAHFLDGQSVYIWFTLKGAPEYADSRFHIGHYVLDDED